MKRVLVIILSVLILVQSMRGAFVYVSLKLNQAEIAEKYCENKKITMCYGSCYIEKQVKEAEQETEKNPIKSSHERVDFWYINHNSHLAFEISKYHFVDTKNINHYSIDFAPQQFLSTILQPPQNFTI
jgi:hypothetical protein